MRLNVKKIETTMAELGIGWDELREKAEISESTCVHVRKAQSVDRITAAKVADALGITRLEILVSDAQWCEEYGRPIDIDTSKLYKLLRAGQRPVLIKKIAEMLEVSVEEIIL